MSNVTSMTKAELIEEVNRLRLQYEECAETSEANGKFDEDALFALVEDAEGDELFLVTETGRFVFVNDTALQRLGYEEQEILGMSLPRIDPNNTRAAWLGRVSRLKQSEEPDIFETEHIARDGSVKAKEISASYVTYKSRTYVLCVGKGIDRMEGKRSPASTVRTREQVLMQSTSDGVLVVDTRGTIIESNAVAERLLGVSKSEINGRSCIDSRWRLVDSDGSPLGISSHPMMIALVEEQPVSNRRIHMLALDGSRRMMMINAAPIYDDAGSLTGAIGCLRPYDDSTERKEQVRRDTSLNAMYRDVVQAMITAGSEDDLERNVCEALVRHGDYHLVWRGITKASDERIHPTVSAGAATDYLMKIKIRYDESEYGNGPIGRAMKTRQPVIVPDLSADSTYEPWLRQAERMGLHSLVAFPLEFLGANVGILVCYAQDKNHFVGSELERLKEIATLFSYGIGMRRRAEADRIVRGEYATQKMLLDIYNSTLPVAVARFDIREPFRCESANAHFLALVDEPYRSTGIEGCFITDIMYAVYHRDIYQRMAEAASGVETVGCEDEVFTDWQGQEMHWSWRIVPVAGESGNEQLLYVAYRLDAGASVAEGQTGEITSAVSLGDAPDTPAVIRMSAPRFGARAKAETRLARFMEEGQVLESNRAACALFGASGETVGVSPSDFFGDGMAEFLSDVLMTKGVGETVFTTLPAQNAKISCQVFSVQEDESQQLLLICG
ncbi:MAG: PAS domain S-box protein [Bacteroidetes bacterium]|nr:PAS domain S-box protein [Bacteroidota bacterium]